MRLKKLLKVMNSNETVTITGKNASQINVHPKDVKEKYLNSKVVLITSFIDFNEENSYISIIVDDGKEE